VPIVMNAGMTCSIVIVNGDQIVIMGHVMVAITVAITIMTPIGMMEMMTNE
jgi:hypothetical protein